MKTIILSRACEKSQGKVRTIYGRKSILNYGKTHLMNEPKKVIPLITSSQCDLEFEFHQFYKFAQENISAYLRDIESHD